MNHRTLSIPFHFKKVIELSKKIMVQWSGSCPDEKIVGREPSPQMESVLHNANPDWSGSKVGTRHWMGNQNKKKRSSEHNCSHLALMGAFSQDRLHDFITEF